MTLADVKLEDLGTAKTVKVTKDTTVIIDGAGDKAAVDARIASMRAELWSALSPSSIAKSSRSAWLSSPAALQC